MGKKDAILEAINRVEHPEIAMSLLDLGMVRDIEYNPQDNGVVLTLVVPFFGIPQAVRDYMVNSLSKAIKDAGGELNNVNLAQMIEEERQAFFQKEHARWRG
jgi:metal-sulfur cluster biosynthetic enzyme